MSTGVNTDDKDDKSTKEKWDDLKLADDIGIFAKIDRNKAEDECASRSNKALNEIGDFIHKGRPELSGLEYCGSAAVHIYLAPTLGEMCFITQVQPLLNTAERIAGPAFTQLQKDMMTYYGRRTTKIRSGF